MCNAKPGFLLPCVVAELWNPDTGMLEHVWSGLKSLHLTRKTPTKDTPHLFLHGVKRKGKPGDITTPPTEGTQEPTEAKAPLISFMMVLHGSRWMILQPEPVMSSVSRQRWKKTERIGSGWLCCCQHLTTEVILSGNEPRCRTSNMVLRPDDIIRILSQHHLIKATITDSNSPTCGCAQRVIKPRRGLWKRVSGPERWRWIVAFVSLSEGGYCRPGSWTDRGCVWLGCLPICAVFHCMAPHFYSTNESVFRQVVSEGEWQGLWLALGGPTGTDVGFT